MATLAENYSKIKEGISNISKSLTAKGAGSVTSLKEAASMIRKTANIHFKLVKKRPGLFVGPAKLV